MAAFAWCWFGFLGTGKLEGSWAVTCLDKNQLLIMTANRHDRQWTDVKTSLFPFNPLGVRMAQGGSVEVDGLLFWLGNQTRAVGQTTLFHCISYELIDLIYELVWVLRTQSSLYMATPQNSPYIQPTRNLSSQVNIRCFFSMGDVIRFSCKGRLQSMSIYAMDCNGMWIMDDKKLESTDCDGMG